METQIRIIGIDEPLVRINEIQNGKIGSFNHRMLVGHKLTQLNINATLNDKIDIINLIEVLQNSIPCFDK